MEGQSDDRLVHALAHDRQQGVLLHGLDDQAGRGGCSARGIRNEVQGFAALRRMQEEIVRKRQRSYVRQHSYVSML